MRATVLEGIKKVVVHENYPDPIITADEALIEVDACGVCGTDLKLYKGEYTATLPRVTGHEFTGVVREIGKNIMSLAPGDRVVVDPNESCFRCEYCHAGKTTFCKDMAAYGVFVRRWICAVY